MPASLPLPVPRRGFHQHSFSMGRRSAGAALEMSVRTNGGVDECDGVSSSIFGRRTKSAGRILGLGPPPGGLNEAIDQMTIATKHILRAAEAQRKAAAAFEAHVRHSNNAAVADVGQHQADLLKMDANHATRAAGDRRYYIEELRKINEAEKEVREAEMRVASLYEKKAKITESLRKGGVPFLRRRSEDDTLRKRQQLEQVRYLLWSLYNEPEEHLQVRMDIEAAEIGLEETRKEMEVIKMYRYRNGMQGIADSVISYASVSSAIFGCFRELTEMVPAISTQDVMTMNYDGAAITQNCVARLRRDIASPSSLPLPSQLMGAPSRRHNRHNGGGRGGGSYPAAPSHAPPPLSANGPSTPPPPYTPTAPSMSELPQPGCGGGAATVPETSANQAARPSPPRFNSLYPKLPANPYRRSGLHS
ncbi:hypothetical protein PMAYCL1PPCAC_30237 [Pristionchus mayeri]|uniref:Uncharacterized protein n=1 Tax=Pristionchus mayeri TaxID=1317129 RepID=A0AAN5IBJ6_9BILA|nr:hypothetical protein PMAYCL1PPCAC_30237 [Pristionchus mayeri]